MAPMVLSGGVYVWQESRVTAVGFEELRFARIWLRSPCRYFKTLFTKEIL
jgi:hypothetical protein